GDRGRQGNWWRKHGTAVPLFIFIVMDLKVICTCSGRNLAPPLGKGLMMRVSTRAAMMARFCGIDHCSSHAVRSAVSSPMGMPFSAADLLVLPRRRSASMMVCPAAVFCGVEFGAGEDACPVVAGHVLHALLRRGVLLHRT